ncbi:MAG: MFS transporter [Mesorhizobium sp.]|nr:MAG: MFS transporter [Mesorhizobium sp.]
MDTKHSSTMPDPGRWTALAVLCVAFFMVCLDGQIVLLALPSIEAQLGFSPAAVQWVMSAYMLALGGLLLLGGRVSDLRGRRRLFMAGTGVFLLASLACGLAGDPGFLIGARIVQGVAAAVMTPSALSLLMTSFEGAERNRALGLWSAMGAGGATAALLVGGPLADWLGWRWVFFINVPVCALILLSSPFTLRESRDNGVRGGFDFGGAVTITAALVAFVLAITEVPSLGWTHPQTLGLVAATLALLVVFVLIERRVGKPLVPLSIFRSRSFVGGNLTMLLAGALVFGMALLVSLYAQKVLGYSPLVVGLGTMIYAILSIVSSTLTGRWVGRTGARAVAVIAMLLMGGGCALFTFIVPEGSYLAHLLPGLIVFGPGIGMAAVAGSVAALSQVREADAGLASGINSAVFQIGGALGVAITATVAASQSGGSDTMSALTAGYVAGFGACVILAGSGALVALLLVPRDRVSAPVPVQVGA